MATDHGMSVCAMKVVQHFKETRDQVETSGLNWAKLSEVQSPLPWPP